MACAAQPAQGGAGGNSETPAPGKRYRAWLATCNNPNGDDEKCRETLQEKAIRWCWCAETGESGTAHWHAYFYVKNARALRGMHEAWPRAHWDVVRGTEKEVVAYLSKDGPVKSNFGLPEDPLAGKELYGWQRELEEIVTGPPEDRVVHLVLDRDGGHGKSSWGLHLKIAFPHLHVVKVAGRAVDIKFSVAQACQRGEQPLVVIVDVPRKARGRVDWEGIEEVKDRWFTSTKYECGEIVLRVIPHIVVFTNTEPNWSDLTADRWRVHTLA